MAKRSAKAANVASKTVEIAPEEKPEKSEKAEIEVSTGGLMGLVEDDTEEELKELDYSEIEGFPYVGFMNEKSKRAKDVAMDLGAQANGTPWVFIDEEYFTLLGCPIMILKKFQFFGISSSSDTDNYALKEVRLDEPEDREAMNAPETKQQTGWKETFVVLGVIFSEKFNIPIPFVSGFKTSKARFVKKLLRAQDKTKIVGWSNKSDLHAKLTQLPSALRVCGTLKMTERKGEAGKYHVADANVRPTPLEVISKIMSANNREDFKKLLQRGEEIFLSRIEEKKNYIPNKKGIVPATKVAAWEPEELGD